MNLRTYVAKLQEMVDEGHGDRPVCLGSEYTTPFYTEVGEDLLPGLVQGVVFSYKDTEGRVVDNVCLVALN